MKNLFLLGLAILFLLPIGISAEDGIYNDYLTDSRSSSGLISDEMFGDYLMFVKEQTVSLDLEDARLVDVLKLLSQQTNLNFVSTEAVRDRKITTYLNQVPLKMAFDIIFKANHLTYEYFPEARMFMVKEMGKPTVELKAKVYNLKYTRIQSSKLEKEIKDKLEAEDDEGDQGEEGGGIKTAIENVLTDLGRVSEDPITNSLIVVDVPSRFPIIDQVVYSLDKPRPKIMIEVEMLDVKKTDVDKLGIEWPQVLASLDVTGHRVTKFPFGDKATSGNTMNFSDFTSAGGWEFTNLAAGSFTPSVLTVIGAELALNFFKQQTQTKFLARPKILTLADQTAEINITTDEAIGISKTESDNGDSTNFDIERAETGTSLRVTPQVDSESGDITLFVEMIQKEATASSFTVSTGTNNDFIAGTIKDPEERSAKTVMKLKNGQTLLFGGLIREDVSETNTNVPLLSKIPFLGALFRHKNVTTEERELMVFLTPRILDEEGSFTKQKSERKTSLQREQGNTIKRQAVASALDRHNFSR